MPPLDYWRSLDERADTPEFRRLIEREFPHDAERMLDPASRRSFLKLMAASMALAGAASCRWPTEPILPFAERAEGRLPGRPLHYATAMELAGVATGLLVKSYDGRPVKIEGNPLHPQSLGSTSALAQASLLELYDPDRSRHVLRREQGRATRLDWARFAEFAAGLRRDGGRGLRVLSEATSSPSVLDLRARLLARFPGARWYEWEPLSRDNAREGSALAFGKPHRTQLELERAEVVFSFEEDFLLHHPAAVRHARDWTAGRRPERGLNNRLVVFESGFSSTGSMADRRIALSPRLIPVAAACLAAELFIGQGLSLPAGAAELRPTLERFQAHPLYSELDWAALARELAGRRGRSLVVAGPRQPSEVHALVHLVNEALGNAGQTLRYTADPDPRRPHHGQAIAALAGEIDEGTVETLLILGGNPAFDAPADLDLARRIGQVTTSIRLGLYEDETSELCTWHLPRAHYLESWGDARDWGGTLSVVQPLIEPLHGGKTVAELLALILGEPQLDGHAITRRIMDLDDDKLWRRSLHDGLVEGTAWHESTPALRLDAWPEMLKSHLQARANGAEGELDLVFEPSASVYDGRFSNNGWLQELPGPLTKLTWDNAALLAPATAATLGLGQGDRIRLEHDGRPLELPVHLLPGQAPGTVSVEVGYGRRRAGRIGEEAGFDVYGLRTSTAMDRVPVRVTRVEGRYELATTQAHFPIDAIGEQERTKRVRTLVQQIELSRYREQEHHDDHDHEGGHEPVELWRSPVDYDGYKWGMAIDLNACTGCNACVVACQAENNIPVVGRSEVSRGREMHWIRVDRYFSGDPAAPEVAHQPVTCQHCELAPCEQVCPVGATMHDGEGLNVMVYNRCVGTRYCANNCPFKVRRFNYFNNHKNESAVETMIYNPEVTVRSRGVMEKCTFCVQRISAAKIAAGNAGRSVQDGEVTPACAQACPTQAITFGDLNDPGSRVHQRFGDRRAYAMLEEWNVRPRNRYLARLRNRESG